MVTVLSAIWNDSVVPPEWSTYLLEKLTVVAPALNYLIPAGDPLIHIGHKNGFFQDLAGRWVDNDVGVVWGDPALPVRPYALAMFFQNVPYPQGPSVQLGQMMSRTTWEHFADREITRPDDLLWAAGIDLTGNP